MKMPYLYALQATLRSLKSSTYLRVITAEYSVEARGLCSDLVSHHEVEFSEGDPALKNTVIACNEKHAVVFGPSSSTFGEAEEVLLATYKGPIWFPAAAEDPYPALDIIEGRIPRSWTDGIFSRLGLDSPLLMVWTHHIVNGELTYSTPAGWANYPPTVIWARTMRPSLVQYVWTGKNGEYPVTDDEYAPKVSRPVFWGSELWARVCQGAPALATEEEE